MAAELGIFSSSSNAGMTTQCLDECTSPVDCDCDCTDADD